MKKNSFFIKLFQNCILIIAFTSNAYSQLVIDNSMTPTQLVQNIFITGGTTVTGITYTGNPTAIAGFSNGSTTNLGINSGIVLCTGDPTQIPNVAFTWMQTDNACNPESDPQIASIATLPATDIYDACVLEFDFTPTANNIQFRYVFASEEYPDFTCSVFNDVFGFFLTGPNPSGPAYNSTNIAIIPGSSPPLPVAINTVNSGMPSSGNNYSDCQSMIYSNLFVDNYTGNTIAFDGFTTVLTATAQVTPCVPYHIKIAIADVGDAYYDSGVFLEANSFDIGNGAVVSMGYTNPSFPSYAIEGCNDGYIAFVLPAPTTTPTIINYTIGGTAINGVDYQAIPTSVTIPAGSDSVAVPIQPIMDGITEGTETIIFSMTNGCSNTTYDTLYIHDNAPLVVDVGLNQTICIGTQTTITATSSGGTGTYSYLWNNTAGTLASATVNPPLGITTYTVTVSDGCSSVSDQVSVNVINCCTLDSITYNISPCTPIAGTYSITGQVYFTDPSTAGTLTITNTCSGTPVQFSAPFTSPVSYTFNNLSANANNCQINAVFSATPTCNLTNPYTAPATVNVTPGNTLTLNCTSPSGIITATSSFPGVTYVWAGPGIVSGVATASPTVNAAGIYTVVVTDPVSGCTASGTVSVISNTAPPVLTMSSSLTLTCSTTSGIISVIATPSTSIYDWTGPGIVSGATTSSPIVNAIGTYNVVVTNSANGCTSSGTVMVISNTVTPDVTPGPSMLISCIPHTVNVSATSVTPGVVFNWTGPGVSSNGANSSSVTVNQAGLYTVVVTNQINGCTSSGTVTVTPVPTPSSSISNSTNVSCHGFTDGSATVDVTGGTPPYLYQWNDHNAQTTPTASNLASGTWLVVVSDASGCTTSSGANISEPELLHIITNQNINSCYNQPANIAVSVTGGTGPNYTYLWSNHETSPSITVYPQPPDSTFSVVVTDQNGCTTSTAVIVHVSQPINVTLITSTDSICPGEPVMLTPIITGGVGPPYMIINQEGTVVVPPIYVYPEASGSYSIYVEDACGTHDTGAVYIHVFPLPPAAFFADSLAGCQPFTVHFNEVYPIDGRTFVWNFGDNENLSLAHNPVHTFTSSGIFTITLSVKSKWGCENIMQNTDMITVYPKPNAQFTWTPEFATVIKPIVEFNNLTANGNLFAWTFGDGDSTNIINPTHRFPSAGSWPVQLIAISNRGCRDTVLYPVKIEEENTIYAATAFSPDNDNVNDFFFVTGTGIEKNNFLLNIYDRWGEIIFSSTDINESWNGYEKNTTNIVPVGTYTWLVIYRDTNGVKHEKSGAVTVIR